MARDIDQWLQGLGLSKYSGLFAENEIGLDVLPDLTEVDLKDLGIPLGDRKRLLKSIVSLSDRPSETSTPEARPAPSVEATQQPMPNMQIYDRALELLEATPLQLRDVPSGETLSFREYNAGQEHVLVVLPGFMADDAMAAILAALPQMKDHRASQCLLR